MQARSTRTFKGLVIRHQVRGPGNPTKKFSGREVWARCLQGSLAVTDGRRTSEPPLATTTVRLLEEPLPSPEAVPRCLGSWKDRPTVTFDRLCEDFPRGRSEERRVGK